MFLLQKEFKQIFRNKAILPMIFLMAVVQLLIVPLAADYEIKNTNIAFVDHDHSDYTRDLKNEIIASGYFRLVDNSEDYDAAFQYIESDEADLILEFPADFERSLLRDNESSVFIAVNAINGVKASLGGAYLASIIQKFNGKIRQEFIGGNQQQSQATIEITSSYWYNPFLKYNIFMVPGILAVLVTMVGAYMCSLNIVKEKELGTIEQINVTPIKKHIFILGKLIPFWIIGIVVFSLGLFIVARAVYQIVPQGSLIVLYLFMMLYLVALLGFGLLISTYSETQQQSMSVVFFFMMIFLLMSGLFTPVESMPIWTQQIAKYSPVTYFIDVMRLVVIKGSGFKEISQHFLIMLGFSAFFNVWAVLNFKKTI
jgi:ABC-2 type transport system permease protein